MERLLRIHVVVALVLGIATSNTRATSVEPNVAVFDVDGLTLSMSINDFRQLHPEAEVIEKTAARYCFGELVRIDPLARLEAVIRRGGSIVQITFDQKYFGQRISTIKREEAIEFGPSMFTSLRDGLVRLYGPYTAIKVPDKMDPAGLVVGFEWEQKGVAYLSVTIHRDHAGDSGPIRQTTFLTRSISSVVPRSGNHREGGGKVLLWRGSQDRSAVSPWCGYPTGRCNGSYYI